MLTLAQATTAPAPALDTSTIIDMFGKSTDKTIVLNVPVGSLQVPVTITRDNNIFAIDIDPINGIGPGDLLDTRIYDLNFQEIEVNDLNLTVAQLGRMISDIVANYDQLSLKDLESLGGLEVIDNRVTLNAGSAVLDAYGILFLDNQSQQGSQTQVKLESAAVTPAPPPAPAPAAAPATTPAVTPAPVSASPSSSAAATPSVPALSQVSSESGTTAKTYIISGGTTAISSKPHTIFTQRGPVASSVNEYSSQSLLDQIGTSERHFTVKMPDATYVVTVWKGQLSIWQTAEKASSVSDASQVTSGSEVASVDEIGIDWNYIIDFFSQQEWSTNSSTIDSSTIDSSSTSNSRSTSNNRSSSNSTRNSYR